MVSPLFPSLTPRYIDSNWFQVDKPMDEDLKLSLVEKEHCSQLSEISSRDNDLMAAGHTHNDFEEEDDDDNKDDDDDDDNEEDYDKEIEMDDIHFNRDSPVVNSPHF